MDEREIDLDFYDGLDRRERERDEREYWTGYHRAQHLSDTARFFGEEAALAEELAWELKDPDPYY